MTNIMSATPRTIIVETKETIAPIVSGGLPIEKIYADAAGNAFGVLIGLIGGVWGIIWFAKSTGVLESFKQLMASNHETQIVLRELLGTSRLAMEQAKKSMEDANELEKQFLTTFQEVNKSIASLDKEVANVKTTVHLLLDKLLK